MSIKALFSPPSLSPEDEKKIITVIQSYSRQILRISKFKTKIVNGQKFVQLNMLVSNERDNPKRQIEWTIKQLIPGIKTEINVKYKY